MEALLLVMMASAVLLVWVGIAYVIQHEKLPPYPTKIIEIDITGRRNVDVMEVFQEYLLQNGIAEFRDYHSVLGAWKQACSRKIQDAFFPNICRSKYQQMLDENDPFCVRFIRMRMRYTQYHYVRTPYKAKELDDELYFTFAMVEEEYRELRHIGFETTTRKYAMKNQRKLMTPKLREQIKERDNYTCQMCGKEMFDEVGLHIDHIIPVSKGGKTVPSNLQVLCDKCNLSKRAKI